MGSLKNVLLTGGTGFIGSHLLEALILAGYNVILLKRPNSSLWRIEHLIDKYKSYNTNDNLKSIFQENNIEVLIHTATEYGKDAPYHNVLRTNVLLPLELIEEGLSYNLKLFINTDTFFSKTSNYIYLNKYSHSKNVFKEILLQLSNELQIINMQLEHVFGEKDSLGKFIPNIINKLLNNTSEIDLTKGTQKRDFIYVSDVVNAYLAVLNNYNTLSKYEDFEIGTGKSIQVRDFVIKAQQLTGSNSKLNFGSIPMREGEFQDSKSNNYLYRKTGWKCEVEIEDAILKIVNSYSNKNRITANAIKHI